MFGEIMFTIQLSRVALSPAVSDQQMGEPGNDPLLDNPGYRQGPARPSVF
jgi:hypothetical protein